MVTRKKNYSAIAVSLLVTLVAIVLGLWPLLMLMTPFLLILGLFRMIEKRPAPTAAVQSPAALPAPATEQSMLTIAFGVLQKRVTEAVHCHFPAAQWTWSTVNVREQFAAGGPLSIMLNKAGGYREATVLVHELQFCGLVYQRLNPQTPSDSDQSGKGAGAEPGPGTEPPADYGLLAFEWVEANLQQLNTRGNEAIAQGQDGFRISTGELPHGDSWPAICAELLRCGFAAADVLADGIQVQIKTEKGV